MDLLKSHFDKELEKKKKRRVYYLCAVFFAALLSLILARSVVKTFDKPETVPEIIKYESEINVDLKPGIIGFVKKFIIDPEKILNGELRDSINILVLGNAGAGFDGPLLTDTIMVANIKPSTGEISLLSIPRDLGVDMKEAGIRKINYAYAHGELKKPGEGAEYAASAVSRILDEPINYYFRADFTAFEKIIDELGGIDVNVEKSFIDHSFPDGENKYRTVEFLKGLQHFDGKRALDYARSRHGSQGENSDFARTKRQQKILAELKSKALSLATITNPARIKRVFDVLSKNISTNIDLWSGIRITKIIAKSQSGDIKGAVIDAGPNGLLVEKNINGAFMLEPKAGDFKEIHDFTDEFFYGAKNNGNSNQTFAFQIKAQESNGPKLFIQNATWKAGLAAKWKFKLEEKGVSVLGLGNSALRPLEKTLLYIIKDGEDAKVLAALIKSNFGKPLEPLKKYEPIFDESGNQIPDADVLLILGDDAEIAENGGPNRGL